MKSSSREFANSQHKNSSPQNDSRARDLLNFLIGLGGVLIGILRIENSGLDIIGVSSIIAGCSLVLMATYELGYKTRGIKDRIMYNTP
jgi:hypothetical protein